MTFISDQPQPAEPDIPALLPAKGSAPSAMSWAAYVGILIALAMLGAGVIALRDSAISAGWLSGSPWITAAIDWIDGLTFVAWMIPAGVVTILLGAWILYAAVRPRRISACAVRARTSVWLDSTAVARIASATADRVPGVLRARTSAGLRKATVTVHVGAADIGPHVEAAVAAAVRRALAEILTTPPHVVVNIRTEEL